MLCTSSHPEISNPNPPTYGTTVLHPSVDGLFLLISLFLPFFTLRVCLQRASSCHYYLFTDVFLPLLLLLHLHLLLILVHLLHLPHLLSFTSSSEQHLSRLPLETYYRPLLLLSCSYSSFKSSFLFLSPPDWCLHLMERNDVIPQESRNVRGLMSSSDGVIPQESRWPHMIVHPLKINLSDLCRQQFCTLMSILFNYWHIIKVHFFLQTHSFSSFIGNFSPICCNFIKVSATICLSKYILPQPYVASEVVR